MGLDTTHNAWHGSYSTFGEWRKIVASAAGFPPLNEMFGYGGSLSWRDVPGDKRLVPLLNHSDCDGRLTPDECDEIAAALAVIRDDLPDFPDDDWPDYWRFKTDEFIAGCRAAAAAGESIEFH